MATTKIWAIKDSLSRVVSYAENPEKTIFSDLKQVLKYAENDEKTIDKNEKSMYVTGVNCNRETAYEEMIAVQNRFDKRTGNIAYHAYQSFKTGEVSPELAHKIGVELAQKMWSEYQVIVATHFNTGTYHNHFVVNSVNMFTGKKFNCNKDDDYNRKYPTIRSVNDKKAVRLYHLGEKYLPKNIADRVFQNPYYVQDKYYKLMKPKKKYRQYNKVYKFKGDLKNIKKITGIDVLFIILFHLLGLIPNRKNYKPLSPEMKQEIRKMERYSNEIRLIVTEKIKTVDDVKSYISQTEKKIENVTNLRQKYRNNLRNCTDDKLIKEYKTKRDECTTILNKYRKNLKIANYILEDTPKVKSVVEIEKQMQREQNEISKTKKKDRYVRW